MPKLTYNPAVFDQNDLDSARRIILTPEGSTSNHRWANETPHVCALIEREIAITGDTLLLDFGCGIGRMARELIARHGCNVIGVDISAKMRSMATDYVNSDKFCACSPSTLAALVNHGLRFDTALAIWVLQHSHELQRDIGLIRSALKPSAGLFVLNNTNRAVPTKELSWVNDLIDVRKALQEAFVTKCEGTLPPDVIAPDLTTCHFWALFANGAP